MPRRRCVGCGRIAPKSELLRLAADPDGERPPRRVLLDPAGEMPGRGAYLCRGQGPALADPACLERATRRGGIARALRSPVTLDRKLVESVSR
ncbi:MAG TPA: YlxR family protein [Solirubrobacteraceae bacterium]|nr:YlxR family protein [Solirubrobacteraceae bacterium]